LLESVKSLLKYPNAALTLMSYFTGDSQLFDHSIFSKCLEHFHNRLNRSDKNLEITQLPKSIYAKCCQRYLEL